jgi:hypothetical protein
MLASSSHQLQQTAKQLKASSVHARLIDAPPLYIRIVKYSTYRLAQWVEKGG